MKKILVLPLIAAALLLVSSLAGAQQFTFTGVFAEAIQSANLRARIGVESEMVGQIAAGTRYPVVGRSEFYPWLLLGDVNTAQPIGWVFAEIVNVYNVSATLDSVPFTEVDVTNLIVVQPTVTTTPPASDGGAGTVPDTTQTPPSSNTPVPQFQVFGTTQGEVNIRYRPDASAERLGVATAGEVFEVIGYHTQFPWVQIAYPASPNGTAWVAIDLLQITGDVFSTRAISTTNFNTLPTLTPTSAVLGTSSVLNAGEVVPVSAEFEALGNQLWNIMLEAGFDPATSRFGALYLHDLQTGQQIMFGNDVAFSGTSINKIGIMVDLFGLLNGDPDAQMATDIANMMICSENVATNAMMSVVGNGDAYAGAANVTDFLEKLGLQRTFLTAPYEIPGATAVPPTFPIEYPQTDADQRKANPNVTNQITVDEMGYVLSSMYQCAFEESGPLLTSFPEGEFTPQECRKMLHVMANNNVDALLRAGVPESVTVAHKHGWVADTHGNAAVFFTPGGDYVLVAMMHQPGWLDYQNNGDTAGSLVVLAEISRTVYNWYNPDTPLDAIRDGFIPDTATCQYRGSPLVSDLVDPIYGLTAPEIHSDIVKTGGS